MKQKNIPSTFPLSRDASLLAIFAEVQLILCKSKTIKTKRQTFNLCFYTALHKAAQEAQNQHEKRTKKRSNKTIKKMRPHKNVTAPWLQMMLLGW